MYICMYLKREPHNPTGAHGVPRRTCGAARTRGGVYMYTHMYYYTFICMHVTYDYTYKDIYIYIYTYTLNVSLITPKVHTVFLVVRAARPRL